MEVTERVGRLLGDKGRKLTIIVGREGVARWGIIP